MVKIVLTIIAIVLVILIVGEQIWELIAMDRALKLPPKTGKDAMSGRCARIVEILSETDTERRLRVEIDGSYWNAVVKEPSKTQLKVGDNVRIVEVVGLELIVQ